MPVTLARFAIAFTIAVAFATRPTCADDAEPRDAGLVAGFQATPSYWIAGPTKAQIDAVETACFESWEVASRHTKSTPDIDPSMRIPLKAGSAAFNVPWTYVRPPWWRINCPQTEQNDGGFAFNFTFWMPSRAGLSMDTYEPGSMGAAGVLLFTPPERKTQKPERPDEYIVSVRTVEAPCSSSPANPVQHMIEFYLRTGAELAPATETGLMLVTRNPMGPGGLQWILQSTDYSLYAKCSAVQNGTGICATDLYIKALDLHAILFVPTQKAHDLADVANAVAHLLTSWKIQ